jgi:hypothetical protein
MSWFDGRAQRTDRAWADAERDRSLAGRDGRSGSIPRQLYGDGRRGRGIRSSRKFPEAKEILGMAEALNQETLRAHVRMLRTALRIGTGTFLFSMLISANCLRRLTSPYVPAISIMRKRLVDLFMRN